MDYRILGNLSLYLVILITAPYWLRKLNSWTFKTKDKRFLNLLKFLRRLHKPAALLLIALALWHGLAALGRVRLHTGLIAYAAFAVTYGLGVAYWRTKNKKVFKVHKIFVLVSVLLLLLHRLWPGMIWQLFRI